MLKNYFNIALRNLVRNKVFSIINIFGMAIGLASCLVIALFIFNELQYDKYHSRFDRIFRVASDLKTPGNTTALAVTPSPWAPLLENDFPSIEKSVRMLKDERCLVRSSGAQRFYEKDVVLSDPGVFAVFDFPLIKGNSDKALTDPNTAVLTVDMARKYFGDEDPIGKTLQITTSFTGELTVTITGVTENVPEASHFHFNILLSMSTLGDISNMWAYHMFQTYLLLKDAAEAEPLAEMLPAFAEKYVNHNAEADGEVRIFLQSLSDIHLRSNLVGEVETNGDIRYVYVLAGVALFILVLACFNFMNLSTAHALARGKEVGLRKAVGARKDQLVRQFLGEAILLTLMAAVIAVMITKATLPLFNSIAHKDLTLSMVINIKTILIAVGFLLLIAVVTGTYPAMVLSAFKPVDVLKGKFLKTSSGNTMRKILVTFQFVVSIALLASTLTLYTQLDFIKNKDLGFDKSQVMILTIPRGAEASTISEFENTLKNKASVISASASASVPSTNIPVNLVRQEGAVDNESRPMQMLFADHEFIETMGMKIVAGRNFSVSSANDVNEAFVLNEEAIEEFGWRPEEAIGKKFEWVTPNAVVKSGKVIGVIKDINFRPLSFKTQPLVIHIQPARLQYVYVKFQPGRIDENLKMLETEFKATFPAQPFEFTFLDETIQHLYDNEQTLGRIFTNASALAIMLALLGIFALSMHSAKQRVKEIGIRKVLGAGIADILKLSLREFVLLVMLANIFALPIAWYSMNQWLDNYAYRVPVNGVVLISSAILVLAVAILTVSFEAVRSAMSNPVKALRSE